MEAVGGLLALVGWLVAAVGGIMVLIKAFQESLLWGLAYIFVPFAALIFVIMHWSEAKQGFLISLAGTVVAILGVVLSAAGSPAIQ